MNNQLRFVRFLFSIGFMLLAAPVILTAAKDSIFTITSPGGGPYRCCLDITVLGRQPDSLNIDEFRLRIVSGRATFVPGVSGSPPDWAIFQQATSARWGTITDAAEIDSGESESGFHICMADTGVVRLVWETRYLNSLISTDTLVFACTGTSCDEAFFTVIPGRTSGVMDVDLVNANRVDKIVNDFHIRLLTPGARLASSPLSQPSGWLRTRLDTTQVSYINNVGGLTFGKWVERFRVGVIPVNDTVRLAWWTTNFGDVICTDTLTLRYTYQEPDTVQIVRSTTAVDSCCQDLVLRNTHLATTPIDGFIVKILTTGAKFEAPPTNPTGWTRLPLNPAADSVTFQHGGIAYRDTALFRNFCFDNSAATSDSIRYRWQAMYHGVIVTEGTGLQICPRPLTRRDTVIARVDSTIPASSRCIFLTLKNQNSRNAAIGRFVVKISNPGKARTIISANAPAGWQVVSFGGDSAVYEGGLLPSGVSVAGFNFCVNIGDAAMRDPLRITWYTGNAQGAISSDTLSVKINIVVPTDSISWSETSSTDPNICCFKVRLHNGNKDNKSLDGLLLALGNQSMIFSAAETIPQWTLTTTDFPSAVVGYSGGPLAPGGVTGEFSICVNVQAFPGRPLTIPVAWASFANGVPVTSDTVRLVCTDRSASQCDTVIAVSSDNTSGVCSYGFRIVNLHSPAGNINEVQFRLAGGKGRFSGGLGTGSAAGWTDLTVKRDTLIFRGGSIASLDSAEAFVVRLDSTDGTPIRLEACTRNSGVPLCCMEMTLQCGTAGISMEDRSSNIDLLGIHPNPASSSAEIRLILKERADLELMIHDASGRMVRSERYRDVASGEQRLSVDLNGLPAGAYQYSIHTQSSDLSGWMVVVR